MRKFPNRWPGLALASLLAAGTALAQTTAGSGVEIVLPVVAQTASFVSEVTVFNPTGAVVAIDVSYFDAQNLASAGPKPCATLVVPASRSVQFTPGIQCMLGPGSHFGLLVLAEQTASQAFYAYNRTQNPAGAGFSIEGFPRGNFSDQVAHATGLRRQAAAPGYQTNCFAATLADPVDYEVRLFDDATGTQVGSTIAGSLGAYQQLRYLDVFAIAAAPAVDYANIRAQFNKVNAGTQKLIGFCTVQDNTSFGADFRIAKSFGAPGTVTQIDTGPGLAGGPIATTGTVTLAATNLLPTTACAANSVPQWSGSAWNCATAGAGTVTSVATGSGLTGGPITSTGTIAIATGGITAAMLAGNGCAANQILKYTGSAWACAADATAAGTVTSVATGTGLTGGPITASGTVSIANLGVGNTQLADNAVATAKILDANVTKAKLSATGGTNGQVLTTDGTNLVWQTVPAIQRFSGLVASIPVAAGFQFAGATGAVTIAAGSSRRVTVNARAALGLAANGPQAANVGVCYQNTIGPGPVTLLGGTSSAGQVTTLRQWVSASDTALLAPGTYNLGLCVQNAAGPDPVSNNDYVIGWTMVTPL
jgi:hypothetical protein